ncbi:hypothetical protein Tco_0445461 [Tanacetum coccineum]
MNIVDELRAIPCHMLGASGVHILEINLENLKLTREEEDGTSEALDPQDWLGSKVLEILDSTILDLLLEPTDLISGFGVLTNLEVVFLRCTTLVEVNLVKGYELPTKVKVLPVGFYLYPTSVNTLPVSVEPYLRLTFHTPKTYLHLKSEDERHNHLRDSLFTPIRVVNARRLG